MTQKDYIKFAKKLASASPNQGYMNSFAGAIALMTKAAADIFAEDNPRFNRTKFYEAAAPKPATK